MIEQAGIYAIVHTASRRCYVGSAGNISKRWHAHRKSLAENKHRNKKLQASWNRSGAAAFRFVIVELTQDLTMREQFWMDSLKAYDSGFNLCPIARSSRGRFVSESEKTMRRAILNGCRGAAQTPAAKAKRAATRRLQGTLGQKLTWEKAEEIRDAYGLSHAFRRGRKQRKNGGVTLASLAEKYGVSYITIYDVVKGKTWKSDPHQKI